ncbi:hypothetical protein T459_35263 [Capsicum annuum]|uniref:Late blight resistance protein homolog R1A-3 n=1 Tax=Capsicum annuum TaxID=4072 RepID=A0A2G2XTP0_CAPAN|nr:hypothetical protein T459_35263 [Capsicum annuum]
MGIQNVKELGICDRDETDSDGFLNNLVHLQQLETLSFTCRFHLLPESTKAFPATLKKLMLKGTFLSWSYLDIIAELPNLEVLKLMNHACSGRKWYPNVRGFTRLKLLLIDDNYLLYWKTIDDNFPVLERLMIRSCYHLKEVPIEFADIHSLRLIKLTSCLPELGESAARIQKEQEDLGNNPVDVLISDPLVRSHHNEFDDDDDDEDEDEGDDNEDFDVHAAERTNFKYWKATDDHFPALEHLMIRHCLHLDKIPIEFADIYSLQLIELQKCSAKLVASAERIQEEQESLGSKAVNVRSYKDPGE